MVPATLDYTNRFQAQEDVSSYELKEYGAGSYSSFIWDLQRPAIERIVRNFGKNRTEPVRLLDFACGTGRVLSVLAPLVTSAVGVDISAQMAAVARTKCRSARIEVGDILAQPDLLGGETFDIISCFRFVLNAEPELRRNVLRRFAAIVAGTGWARAGECPWQCAFPAPSRHCLEAPARTGGGLRDDAQ